MVATSPILPPNPQYDLGDIPVRAEHVIWLPAALADIEALPETFEEQFCEWLPEGADRAIYVQLPVLARFAGGDVQPDAFEVAETLSGQSGFLIQAATPIKTYITEKLCRHSWGHYRTEWLYAATEAEIASVMTAWAKKLDAEFRANRKVA